MILIDVCINIGVICVMIRVEVHIIYTYVISVLTWSRNIVGGWGVIYNVKLHVEFQI